MIVHILPPADGFPAVSYNTDKVERNKGELMMVANFGALQGLQEIRPEDYKNHLAMVSATNKHVKRPQFHVVISAEGKTYDKQQLTAIGEDWLAAMGYEKQPYLIIYHKDTANNHIHLVTARIDRSGKKISDRFEKIRAVAALNQILGIDVKHNVKADIENALTYRFSTEAQFRMILESKGYVLRDRDGYYDVIKFGKLLDRIDRKEVEAKKSNDPGEQRKLQLTALFHKYGSVYDTSIFEERKNYRSDFSIFMKSKFGVDLLFHTVGDKPPYGYSIVDHATKNVYKGGEIVPLKELLAFQAKQTEIDNPPHILSGADPIKPDYYAAILKAALYNYPDLAQGLHHQGLFIIKNGDGYRLFEPSTGTLISTTDLLSENDHRVLVDHFREAQNAGESINTETTATPQITLASDIDDEAIHGRNRRRKKKARTNTR
jgi:hypothetical protein